VAVALPGWRAVGGFPRLASAAGDAIVGAFAQCRATGEALLVGDAAQLLAPRFDSIACTSLRCRERSWSGLLVGIMGLPCQSTGGLSSGRYAERERAMGSPPARSRHYRLIEPSPKPPGPSRRRSGAWRPAPQRLAGCPLRWRQSRTAGSAPADPAG